jgi:hypothetical protein
VNTEDLEDDDIASDSEYSDIAFDQMPEAAFRTLPWAGAFWGTECNAGTPQRRAQNPREISPQTHSVRCPLNFLVKCIWIGSICSYMVDEHTR